MCMIAYPTRVVSGDSRRLLEWKYSAGSCHRKKPDLRENYSIGNCKFSKMSGNFFFTCVLKLQGQVAGFENDLFHGKSRQVAAVTLSNKLDGLEHIHTA